jgi:prevent-host-death family protein
MKYSIAMAKKDFSRLLREAHQGPVIITRRGQPDAVLLAYDTFENLRRLQAYQQVLRLADELRDTGVTARELHEASRRELADRQ